MINYIKLKSPIFDLMQSKVTDFSLCKVVFSAKTNIGISSKSNNIQD